MQPKKDTQYICKGYWIADGHLNGDDKDGWARCVYDGEQFKTIEHFTSSYLGFKVKKFFPLDELENINLDKI